MWSVCYFFHPIIANNSVEEPVVRNTSVFHPEAMKKPPFSHLKEGAKSTINITMNNIPNLPKRVPVIVRNVSKQPDLIKVLSQSLNGIKMN